MTGEKSEFISEFNKLLDKMLDKTLVSESIVINLNPGAVEETTEISVSSLNSFQ